MKKTTLTIVSFLTGTMMSFGQIYSFTNCAATGRTGPTQVQVDAEYAATTLNGQVTINSQGIQEWTVPFSGTYSIQAYGAQGGAGTTNGNIPGGLGASIYGEFNLSAGQTIKVVVGQMGEGISYGSSNAGGGGGGGSFITLIDNTPLLIAGGGGGTGANNGVVNASETHGMATNVPGISSWTASVASGGNGGYGGYDGAGGGGLTGDGENSQTVGYGGQSFVNGANGGDYALTGAYPVGAHEGHGGFGCGGGVGHAGGGGGGYNGGNGTGQWGNGSWAGGGSSYNDGTNATNLAGVNASHGSVTIELLCNSTSISVDVASLSDLTGQCSVDMPTPPTATNDCGVSTDGVPDVTFPITTVGTTVVTWTYDDGFNTTSQTQNVVVTGPNVNVNLSGTVLTAEASGASYQWVYCDSSFAAINGEVNQFYIATTTGNYAVIVTEGGCTDTSECVLVDFSGLDELNSKLITIYPNPSTNGNININYDGDILNLQIVDKLGRILSLPFNLTEGTIDGSSLSSGSYTILVEVSEGIIHKELIIN